MDRSLENIALSLGSLPGKNRAHPWTANRKISRCHCLHWSGSNDAPNPSLPQRQGVGGRSGCESSRSPEPTSLGDVPGCHPGKASSLLVLLVLEPRGPGGSSHGINRSTPSSGPGAVGCATLQSTVRAWSITHPPEGPAPGKPNTSMVTSTATIPTSTIRISTLHVQPPEHAAGAGVRPPHAAPMAPVRHLPFALSIHQRAQRRARRTQAMVVLLGWHPLPRGSRQGIPRPYGYI